MSDHGSDRLVPIGLIGRPHGLRGEVRVCLYDPESKALFVVDEVLVQRRDGARTRHELLAAQPHGKLVRAALSGVEGRAAAEALNGASVLVERDALPAPDEEEYYDADLVGLEATAEGGGRLGHVVEVEHPPSCDVLILELDDGRYVDVPFREPFVRVVDVEGGHVEVDRVDELPTRRRR